MKNRLFVALLIALGVATTRTVEAAPDCAYSDGYCFDVIKVDQVLIDKALAGNEFLIPAWGSDGIKRVMKIQRSSLGSVLFDQYFATSVSAAANRRYMQIKYKDKDNSCASLTSGYGGAKFMCSIVDQIGITSTGF